MIHMPDKDLTPQSFSAFLENQGLDCNESGVVEKLAAFVNLLAKWNSRTNLVGPRNRLDIAQNLILDSLHLARFLKTLPLPESIETWDLGAGAGIPGIPLRLVWTHGQYTLVEVREKRTLFLRTALALLKPEHTSLYSGRAEQFIKTRTQEKKPADLILSRAFMPWQQLLPFAEPGLTHNGRIIILANTPLPSPELPQGWIPETSWSYCAAGSIRFFWSLKKDLQ